MELSHNPFSITLLVSSVTCLLLTALLLIKEGRTVRWFALMMLSITLWAVFYGFELATAELSSIMWWIRFEYVGIAFLAPAWLIFILKYVGRDRWLTRVNVSFLLVMTVTTLFMVWFNDYHKLFYRSTDVVQVEGISIFEFEAGPWYNVFTIYFYILLVIGVLLLIRRFRQGDTVFRKQNRAILIGAMVPWGANILYKLGLSPFGNVDLTPFAFLITAFVIGIALFRWKLFDIIPVARERVIDSMNDGVLVVDSKMRIIDANNRMISYLKLTLDDVLGAPLFDVLPLDEERYKQIEDDIEEPLDLTKGGNTRNYEFKASTLVDRNKVYSGRLFLFRDVTESKKAREDFRLQAQELGHLNKLKDRLFSIIAHDLRGPLTNLKEILEMNQDGAITQEEFKGILPLISKDVGHTVDMLENLLYWSKSQLQGEKVEPVSLDMRKLSEGVLTLLEKKAMEKGIRMKNEVPEGTEVFADQDMTELVMRNLASNAVKFCGDGDRIYIMAEAQHSQTTIEIKDTGVGIDGDNLDKLFGLENFTTPGTSMEQGTGLGLLLCREFVEKNGGNIWVESRKGLGSSFFFSLPKPQ